MNAPAAQPLKVVFLVGVGLGDSVAWPGDVCELEPKLGRAFIGQGRALPGTDENIAKVRADIERREATGEVIRPQPE